MAERLGEQLLTLVKPCSRIKLHCARESRLGVLQTYPTACRSRRQLAATRSSAANCLKCKVVEAKMNVLLRREGSKSRLHVPRTPCRSRTYTHVNRRGKPYVNESRRGSI